MEKDELYDLKNFKGYKITKDGSDSNDSDEHILNLSYETRTNIMGCYNVAIGIKFNVGGEPLTKVSRNVDYNLQEYLEFNSFICILQFYSYIIQSYSMNFNIQIIDDIINTGLSNNIIEEKNGNIKGCNEIINNEILKILKNNIFAQLQNTLYNITISYTNNTFIFYYYY